MNDSDCHTVSLVLHDNGIKGANDLGSPILNGPPLRQQWSEAAETKETRTTMRNTISHGRERGERPACSRPAAISVIWTRRRGGATFLHSRRSPSLALHTHTHTSLVIPNEGADYFITTPVLITADAPQTHAHTHTLRHTHTLIHPLHHSSRNRLEGDLEGDLQICPLSHLLGLE